MGLTNKECYSVKIDLEFTNEEIDLIKNINFEKDVYVSTSYFNFTNGSYSNLCVPLIRKDIIEHREIGYPLSPDLGIKLSEIGEKVLEQITS